MPDYFFRSVNDALPRLMHDLLDQGDEVGSRNGRVKEFLNNKIVLLNPCEREILHSPRRASIAAQIAETMWVLRGSNEIDWLSLYLPRAVDFSDDGHTWRAGYGPRMRNYGETGLDQLARIVDDLTTNPLSRQAVIEIADMGVDQHPGKDIPCTRSIQFLSREGRLNVTVTMRSNDVMWGWSGINAFEWSVVQEIVASMLGINVGTLTFNAGSFHLYDQHWNRAGRIADSRVPHVLFGVRFNGGGKFEGGMDALDDLIDRWFAIEFMIRQGSVNHQRAVDDFPEPMLRAWLRVIQWYWSGDTSFLAPLVGTSLAQAALVGVGPHKPSEASTTVESVPAPIVTPAESHEAFVAAVVQLHNEKAAVYGDSWKKRGEQTSIMANIARKIDRLGVAGAGDTSADTAIDLLVYLALYSTWLFDLTNGTNHSDYTDHPNEVIGSNVGTELEDDTTTLIKRLQESFEWLHQAVEDKSPGRWHLLEKMLPDAYVLAHRLWYAEQEGGYSVAE